MTKQFERFGNLERGAKRRSCAAHQERAKKGLAEMQDWGIFYGRVARHKERGLPRLAAAECGLFLHDLSCRQTLKHEILAHTPEKLRALETRAHDRCRRIASVYRAEGATGAILLLAENGMA